jgi:hypothetical protein
VRKKKDEERRMRRRKEETGRINIGEKKRRRGVN